MLTAWPGFNALTRTFLVLAVLLCVTVYYPGLHGGFTFDDYPNILQNGRLHVDDLSIEGLRQAAFSTDSGTLKRPVSMLSFWANYYLTGLDPFYFKITNLLIHLLNGVGLFWLARSLLEAFDRGRGTLPPRDRDSIALGAALIWLLHPLNVTSVLYVVQRMTSLSATFMIGGLICYVLGRERLARGRAGFPLILTGLIGFGLLAVLSKENGVLLPLYIAAIELALLQFMCIEEPARRKLKVFFLLTVAIPLLAAALFLLFDPAWLLRGYQTRPFTLTERLLTEARVLWMYLGWLAAPTRAELGLFHDDVAISRGLFDPSSTLLSVVALIAACVAAVRLRRRAPLFSFAVFWYLAGHVLESSVIGLELVHEHRNYLPIFGPLLAGVSLLWHLAGRLSAAAKLALPALFAVAFAGVTLARSLDWTDLHTLKMASVRDHPNSARANYLAGTEIGDVIIREPALAPQLYEAAKTYFERSASLDDASPNALFGLILLDASTGRPIADAAVERLAGRLATMPLNFTVVEAFRTFVDWTLKGTVVLPEQLVTLLFESALGNSTVDHATRAAIFSVSSAYYYSVAGDAQTAVSMAMAAVEEDPAEPVHHLSLADLAIVLENFELASREIDGVNHRDTLGRFAAETAELARRLPTGQSRAESSAPTDVASR